MILRENVHKNAGKGLLLSRDPGIRQQGCDSIASLLLRLLFVFPSITETGQMREMLEKHLKNIEQGTRNVGYRIEVRTTHAEYQFLIPNSIRHSILPVRYSILKKRHRKQASLHLWRGGDIYRGWVVVREN